MPNRLVVATLGLLAIASTDAAKKEKELEEGFHGVTCGSLIKLNSKAHRHRLHSHDVTYGTGSGQQSVTGMVDSDDFNSYWMVRGTAKSPCERGAKIKCGSTIRLTHYATKKNLHTHLHVAPMSGQQEVSAFGNDGEGDNGDHWEVICSTGGDHWMRQVPVRLRGVDTGKYLATNSRHQYGHPIPGQLEIHAKGWTDADTEWLADEGLYLKEEDDREY